MDLNVVGSRIVHFLITVCKYSIETYNYNTILKISKLKTAYKQRNHFVSLNKF